MDEINCQTFYSESLKNTLNCYQLSSADSLSGPSGYPALAAQLWFKENNQSPPTPQPPVIQIPLLVPKDTSTKRSETYLSGEKISCFIVGGEKRLCLPQILTTVLKDYSIHEINRTCAELHIYCSRCSPDQLEILKVLGILPFNTTQCGLITKTDAERLVSALGAEFHLNGKHDFSTENSKGIHVYHECFGRGDGIFYPDLYLSPDATCIACLDCRSTFSPARFVLHSHSILEKRTCHWGFDRDNWRHYLLIPRNVSEEKFLELEKQLNQLKDRFDPSADAYINSHLKRRLKPENGAYELNSKRLKGEKDVDFPTPRASANCFGVPLPIRSSAFKPWGAANLSGLAELQVGQDAAALMKAFVPLIQDRRLYPNLLQLAPPTVTPHTSSEWTKTTQKSQDVPNISLQPMDLQKKTTSVAVLPERSQDRSQKQRLEGSLHSESKRQPGKQTLENSVVKTEGASTSGSYPVSRRRKSEDASKFVGKSREEQVPSSGSFLDPTRVRSHLPPKKEAWKCSFLENPSAKRTHEQICPEKSQRSRKEQKEVERKCEEETAAASAMLQLSHSFSTSTTNSSPPKPPRPSDGNQTKPTNSAYPKVTPLPQSQHHFKWTFSDSAFIISATGTEELNNFQQLLSPLDISSETILKEVVRMKCTYEENFDIQTRVQRDLQVELERAKTSKQRCLDEVVDVRTQFRHELDRARNRHHDEMKEANEALITLGKNLADLRLHPNHDDRDTLQHKILDRLHKQVDDKEDVVRDLEKQLLEERDRRVLAERKLEENMEGNRGRISLLMDNKLRTIMKNIPESKRASPPHYDSRSPPSGLSRNGEVANLSASASPNSAQSPKDSGVHDV